MTASCACGCGHRIPEDPPNRRFWSDACRKRAWQREHPGRRASLPAQKPCACDCGRTFPPVSSKHRYWSEAHRHRAFYRANKRLWSVNRKYVAYDPRPCDCGCGRSFTPGRRDRRYFSGSCRVAAFLARQAGSV